MIIIYKGKQVDAVTYLDLHDKLNDGWSTKKPAPKTTRAAKNDNKKTTSK